MRNTPPATIQSALATALDATELRREDVAEFLGIRGSTLSYGTELSETRPGGLGINYVHRLSLGFPASAVPIAQHFAGLAGGVFQPVEMTGNVASLFGQCGEIAKECGEAQAAILRAAEMASGRSNREALREIDEAVAALVRAGAVIRQRGVA